MITTHVSFTVTLPAISAHHPAGTFTAQVATSDSKIELDRCDPALRKRLFISASTRAAVEAAAQDALDAHFDKVATGQHADQ